ncbi:hypothetical protein F5888DRAFT_1792614 [Russula emetica]|nr:hypothetical protein F5888DRAFT_1792614 [Russula emetica]
MLLFTPTNQDSGEPRLREPAKDALLVLLPLLIVLSTFLFLLILFLILRTILSRARGDFDGVGSRWLESVNDSTRRLYLRAKGYHLQYPPNSQNTDITLSIQEKGVSALLVHSWTELTFLPEPPPLRAIQSSSYQTERGLLLESQNVRPARDMNVAVGLATKPYPHFRLPGHSVTRPTLRSYNYPFTAMPLAPSLKEGDVVGVGYQPRSGTVLFHTQRLNGYDLFPTVGADDPCSSHVDLGQDGFIFIKANVKKWGLAPSVGTLAPPPAYGSERDSILLEAGAGVSPPSVVSSHSVISRRLHRARRPRPLLYFTN